jgi:hypothetical protein
MADDDANDLNRDPEPGQPGDADHDPTVDPTAEPASPGRKKTLQIEHFIRDMYRDPNFSWPDVEWRKKTLADGKTQVIDVGDDDNRMAALALVGICDLTYDHADGVYRYRHYRPDRPPAPDRIAKLPWRNLTDMKEEDRATLVRNALKIMGSTPQTQLTQAHKWNSAFACLRKMARQTDSIFEEMRALIDKGSARLKTDPRLTRTCRPGRLLFNAFPYKPRLSYSEAKFAVLVGRCMMRDHVALALRPAYGRAPLVPQLMYTLVDPEEGGGKTTLCRVLGGGSVGDVADTARYTDAISVQMIVGNANGQHTLAGFCAGKTVVEWADKNLGALNETHGSLIKNFVNNGVMKYRRMRMDAWLTINWRGLNVVTTNLQAILTPQLGIRRLPIGNIEQWRERRTSDPKVIRQNHNTGLDWLAAHRDVVVALAFKAGDWRGTLAPPAALLKLMYARADEHTRQENWQLILDRYIGIVERWVADHPDRVVGLPSHSLATWANDLFKGARAPTPNAMGRQMGKRGWIKLNRRVRGAPRGESENMRALEGAEAKARRERLGDDAPIQVTDVLIWQSGSDLANRGFVYQSVKEYDGSDPPSNLKVVVDNTKDNTDEDEPF